MEAKKQREEDALRRRARRKGRR